MFASAGTSVSSRSSGELQGDRAIDLSLLDCFPKKKKLLERPGLRSPDAWS